MEHEISQQNMQAINEFAKTNMLISEAKNSLFKLQENEKQYIEEREKLAVEAVNDVLKNSKKLLDETLKNTKEMEEFHESVRQFAETLGNIQDRVEEDVNDFTKRTIEWEKSIKSQQDEIAESRKHLKIERNELDNDKKTLKSKETSLKNLEKHLQSRQQSLEASYKVEKSLWNKLN